MQLCNHQDIDETMSHYSDIDDDVFRSLRKHDCSLSWCNETKDDLLLFITHALSGRINKRWLFDECCARLHSGHKINTVLYEIRHECYRDRDTYLCTADALWWSVYGSCECQITRM